MQEIEKQIALLLELSSKEQKHIRELFSKHEESCNEEIKDLKARIKVLELSNAATRPGLDLLFKILWTGIAAGVIYLLSGGNFKK